MIDLPAIPQAHQWAPILARSVNVKLTGRVSSIRGTTIIAAGMPAPVGAVVEIKRLSGNSVQAEVIGFEGSLCILAPLDPMSGVSPGDQVRLVRATRTIPVSLDMIGRVLDSEGKPLDDRGPLTTSQRVECDSIPIPALDRPPIRNIFSTGVRAIDALLTIGYGQRLGIFAGSGVGKSTLLGMLARGSTADVVVIGLIGERGREVREFLERDLGEAGRAKCVTVVATSDTPAPKRILAAKTATAIAEAYRDEGKSVLLLMDSVTRFAMAQREVGLAAGEVPTTRGYPPSVFAMLPQLVERTGNAKQGSITAIYTVLVEGDDANEPISDALRGLLDGHLHLSRSIAANGRYPAIDILPSLSRLQSELVNDQHRQQAIKLRQWMSIYQENADLINIGAYTAGSNPKIDEAIAKRDSIEAFLAQDQDAIVPWEQMDGDLSRLSVTAAPMKVAA
jgi:flagellum-specific ATP synthase